MNWAKKTSWKLLTGSAKLASLVFLTRAGVSGDSLEKRFAHYHRILEHAAGKIEILPGGGIDLDNRQTFIDQLGVTQLHGTKVVF